MVRKKTEKINNSVSNVKKMDNKNISNVSISVNNENAEVKQEDKKEEFVEIPIGKVFSGLKMDRMRENPWILSTIVLGIVLVIVLISTFNGIGGGITGGVVSENNAGQNVIDFINAQGQGSATLVSSEKEGSLYKVTVNYNGDEVPVYTSLDGKYLIVDPISLSGDVNAGADNGAEAGEPITSINYADAPVKGDVNAEITIVEFSDYQCPFCGKFYSETLGQIDTNYIKTGKVKLVYLDFPLNSIHPEAQKAAEAARCVGEQKGKEGYYKMHNKLFESQTQLSIDNYKKWARELGASGSAFDTCLDSGKYASAINANLAYGSQLGVSGTPAFFIGGEEIGYTSVSGAQPYSVFQQIIDSQLSG